MSAQNKQTNSAHLVEDRVVAGVYLVPPVDISHHQEVVQTHPHQVSLGCRSGHCSV